MLFCATSYTTDEMRVKNILQNLFKKAAKTRFNMLYCIGTMEGRILGVDFGLKRVGLAVCDGLHILATPLPVYKTKSMRDSIDAVAAIAKEQDVCAVVVGLPLNLDGSESVQSGRARAFARNLQKVTGLTVELYDERLTTVEADELLREAGVTKAAERALLVDSMAAKVILQSYIDNNKNNR